VIAAVVLHLVSVNAVVNDALFCSLYKQKVAADPTQAEVSGSLSPRQKTGFIGVKRHWQVHRVVTPAVVGSNPTAPAISRE
jgi:hypothetical protein